ncbi:MAG: molybdate ABC transporter substrate-binding protein [Bryobacteraceae bacterium]
MTSGPKSGSAALLSTVPLCNLSALLSSSIPLLLLLSTSCAVAQIPQRNSDLLVAAAADLTGIEQPVTEMFRSITGRKAKFVLGASGLLARQIEQGAPYDVFLSANERFVADLAKSGRLVPASVRVYAYGRLGLWSRDGSLTRLEQLRDRRIVHLAMANPASAPYGAAAKELLESAGLWPAIETKVVYGENVRQALQFAESGNADAAITAWSLVFDRGGILLPDSGHKPIRQAGGVVAGRPNEAAAQRFLDLLASGEGRKILAAHGLGLP